MKKWILLVMMSGGAAYGQTPPPVVPVNAVPTTCSTFFYALTTTSPWTIYGPNVGYSCQAIGSSSGGSGTVTNVTFTGDGTVLSSTPSAPVTTSGTLTATLANAAQNSVLAGPATGGSGAPTYQTAPTFSGANLTNLPAGALTGITLAANVVSSSLTSAAGGTFGTAAYANTGTSGATVPLLSGANTLSGNNTFTANPTGSSAGNTITCTPATGTPYEPCMYIAPTGATSPAFNVGGTNIAINDASGSSAWYLSGYYNGAFQFAIKNSGVWQSSNFVNAAAFQSQGTKFTNAGTCTLTSTTGGAAAGAFVLTTGGSACTVVATINGATGLTATNGWACWENDLTHPGLNYINQTASTATTAIFSISASASSSDAFNFGCNAY